MGSGSSVPVDSDKVSALLQALPEEERKGLAVISPPSRTKYPRTGNGENDENDDANNGGEGAAADQSEGGANGGGGDGPSGESGRIAMHGNMERMLLELPRLLHDMTRPDGGLVKAGGRNAFAHDDHGNGDGRAKVVDDDEEKASEGEAAAAALSPSSATRRRRAPSRTP